MTDAAAGGLVEITTRASAMVTLKSKSADLDAAVAALYDPASPTYHRWMSSAELAAFGPSKQDLASATEALSQAGLAVDHQSADGTMLRVSGPRSAVRAAFGSNIRDVAVGGRVAIAVAPKPAFHGSRADLVESVVGTSASQMQSFAAHQIDFSTNRPLSSVIPPSGTDPLAAFTDHCFKRDASFSVGAFTGNGPIHATYAGPGYLDVSTTNHPRCGYTASQVLTHYGMNEAHALGWTGKGQTVVIVDAYGSPTIAADLNAFSNVMGLRAMSGRQFKVVYSDGAPPVQDAGWAMETSLDVEWVHAIAPDANIVLVIAPSASDADLAYAVLYAVDHQLGEVVSNSWGIAEANGTADQAAMFNVIMRSAAARGIAVNFATGDSGDNGVGTPVGAAIMPADSPYVTAVGGTSIDIPTAAGAKDTAWGLNVSLLAGSLGVAIKPIQDKFEGGGGGGESIYLAKPRFQRALAGVGRQTPDISALADPMTGAIVVQTDPSTGLPAYTVIGGTSLATPIFSAVWAIANQAAGESLGQAAPVLGKLPSYAINDVRPIHGAGWKASGSVTYKGATTDFSSDEIFGFDSTQTTDYVSALTYLKSGPPGGIMLSNYFALAMGLDSSLSTGKGWDNATGYGSPNGLLFIDAVRQFARQHR